MIITLKDGSQKEYVNSMNVYEIAQDISEGLARIACAGEVDGELVDLRTVLSNDCNLNIITVNDEKGLPVIRHTASHIMAEAVKRIVNHQINELVLRCIKSNEVRHYYDIAVIGYAQNVYSGWNGTLTGRDFVSPEELKNNPFKKIITREEKRTRKGIVVKEVEKVQWLEARHDGSWTHVHKAFGRAKELLDEWMKKYHDKDCYPPTIINITDGEFNGATKEGNLTVSQLKEQTKKYNELVETNKQLQTENEQLKMELAENMHNLKVWQEEIGITPDFELTK